MPSSGPSALTIRARVFSTKHDRSSWRRCRSISARFARPCSRFRRITFTRFNTLSPLGPRLVPSNSAMPDAAFPGENVYPARVVCEHAVPALFFRTVSEHVLAGVASASVPVLHQQTFIKRKGYVAGSSVEPPGAETVQLPSQKSSRRLCGIRGARTRVRRRKGGVGRAQTRWPMRQKQQTSTPTQAPNSSVFLHDVIPPRSKCLSSP